MNLLVTLYGQYSYLVVSNARCNYGYRIFTILYVLGQYSVWVHNGASKPISIFFLMLWKVWYNLAMDNKDVINISIIDCERNGLFF